MLLSSWKSKPNDKSALIGRARKMEGSQSMFGVKEKAGLWLIEEVPGQHKVTGLVRASGLCIPSITP